MSLFKSVRRDAGPLNTPTAIADGITAGSRGVWAWCVIPTRSTDELGTADLFGLTESGAAELKQILPKGVEFHIKVQWGRYSGAEHVEQQLRHWRGNPPPGVLRHVELQGARIDENGFPRRQVLLGVRLDEEPTKAVPGKEALRGGDPIKDAARQMQQYVSRASAWQARMSGTSFQARPATVSEIAWALRHDLRRTVDWLPSGPLAGRGETARLRGGQVLVRSDHIQIQTDRGVRYLRCLVPTTTGFPTTDLALPGGEWLRDLLLEDTDDLEVGYPLEVSIRGRSLAARDAQKRMSEALALLKEQGREAAKGLAEEAPDELEDSRAILGVRMQEVSSGRASMVEDCPVWIVEADSKEELERRSTEALDYYAGMQITLWEAENLQGELWRSTVLGDFNRVADFAQLRPMTTLVGAWFHGGSALGQVDAPYLAANIGSTPAPFRLRVTDAAQDGDPVTSVFLGSSGAGKSTAVMLVCLAEAVYGGWVMLVDLKGDLGGLPKVSRMFDVPTTEISTDQLSSGSMCPWRYIPSSYRGGAGASQICIDLLLLMLRRSSAHEAEPLVRRAVNVVAGYQRPQDRSTHAVIELLAHSRDPKEAALGAELRELAKDALARPVAGAPDLSGGTLPTRPGLVYMRLEGMSWPERDAQREDWTPANRLTMMLTRATFAYSTFMANRVRGIAKVVALPELHLLTRYEVGRSMVKETALMGRALDTSLLLDTQACAELASIEGLEDQITTTCAFRVRTDAEAAAQAQLLGLDPEPHVLQRQKSWGKGQSEVRDRWGQIAPVQWDYMTAEIREALSTTQQREDQYEPVNGVVVEVG